MASISLEHIKKTYEDGVTVIPDLNLEIRDREFLILVGPSGCGKSTTLRMIAGLEDISGGTLKIGDRVVNDLPPKDRDIAMVFQSYALYPHMTVYKNMAFGLQLRRVPKAEIDRKVRTAAQALELTAYLDRRPRALSGGQRQRVALGRAMVRDPAVFLLDEPLSNLDAKLRTEMRARIAELHRELGTTFVYVTHDQTEAMTMADRIVVMLDGKIQQADTPAQLYAHPCNVFVAGFIGTPPMNILPGRLVRRGIAESKICVLCAVRQLAAYPCGYKLYYKHQHHQPPYERAYHCPAAAVKALHKRCAYAARAHYTKGGGVLQVYVETVNGC